MNSRASILRSAAASGLSVMLLCAAVAVTGGLQFWQSWTEEADRQLKIRADSCLEGAPSPAAASLSGQDAVCLLISRHGADGKSEILDQDWPADATAGLREGGDFRTRLVRGSFWRIAAVQRGDRGVKLALALEPVTEELRGYAARSGLAVTLAGGIAAAAGGLLRRRVLALEVARRQAEAAASADAAHELRTPLAAMQARISLAAQQAGNDEALEQLLSDLSAETARMRAVSDAVLLLARADAGMIAPGTTRISLQGMLAELTDETAAEHEEAGLRISLDCPPDLLLAGDAKLLKLAFSNLLRNAALYNFSGGFIRVTAARQHRQIRVDIANSGPPVPPEEAAAIFCRFRRGGAASRSGKPGSGLGLSLTQAIAGLHGGSVVLLESGECGTVFRVLLPAASAADF